MKPWLMILLVALAAAGSAWAQEASVKKTRFVFHIGSLSGMGIGGSTALGRAVSLEATVGAPSFITIGVGQPFAGNVFNATLALQFTHPSGLYLAPGVHSGYYRMTANDKYNLRLVEETETLVLVRPRMALGFELARNGRLFSFEVGLSLFLPEAITREVQRGTRSWLFEAERSLNGPLFPSYLFRMKI